MNIVMFSDLLGNYIDKDNPYLKYGGLLVIVALVVVLERRYRMLKNRYASARLAEAALADVAPEPADRAKVIGNGAAQPELAARHRDAYPEHARNGLTPAEEADKLETAAGECLGSRHHPS